MDQINTIKGNINQVLFEIRRENATIGHQTKILIEEKKDLEADKNLHQKKLEKFQRDYLSINNGLLCGKSDYNYTNEQIDCRIEQQKSITADYEKSIIAKASEIGQKEDLLECEKRQIYQIRQQLQLFMTNQSERLNVHKKTIQTHMKYCNTYQAKILKNLGLIFTCNE